MTPAQKNVVKSLVAVAWADGKLADGEFGVIDGLLSGFDADDAEEQEIYDYARTPRTLADIPLAELGLGERELLLTNAALLTVMDGEQDTTEQTLLNELAELLGFSSETARSLIQESTRG